MNKKNPTILPLPSTLPSDGAVAMPAPSSASASVPAHNSVAGPLPPVLSMPKGAKYSQAQVMEYFYELSVYGYTIRRLRQLVEERYPLAFRGVPDSQLICLLRERLPELQQAQDALDQDMLGYLGLVRKAERVRRLAEYAEQIEQGGLLEDSTRWGTLYRQLLEQIGREVEPLQLRIEAGDSWRKLMEDLSAVVENHPAAERSDSQPTGYLVDG